MIEGCLPIAVGFIVAVMFCLMITLCSCKESPAEQGKASVCCQSSVFSNLVGGGADAKCEVFKCGFKLQGFLGGETTFFTIPINTIKFVVQPRGGFSEILSCNVQPRYIKNNVIKSFFHVFNSFHNLNDILLFKKSHPPTLNGRLSLKDFNYYASSKSFGRSRKFSNNIRAYISCSRNPLGNDFRMLRRTLISSASASVKVKLIITLQRYYKKSYKASKLKSFLYKKCHRRRRAALAEWRCYDCLNFKTMQN